MQIKRIEPHPPVSWCSFKLHSRQFEAILELPAGRTGIASSAKILYLHALDTPILFVVPIERPRREPNGAFSIRRERFESSMRAVERNAEILYGDLGHQSSRPWWRMIALPNSVFDSNAAAIPFYAARSNPERLPNREA